MLFRSDERSTEALRIPSDILASDTELESSDDELGLHHKQGRLFASALSKMTRLTTFVWSCNHSLISLDTIWSTLLKCQSLKKIEVNDNIVFSPASDEASPNDAKQQLVVRAIFSPVKNPPMLTYNQSFHLRPLSQFAHSRRRTVRTRIRISRELQKCFITVRTCRHVYTSVIRLMTN